MKRPGVFLPLDGTSYSLLKPVSSKIGEYLHFKRFEYAPSSCSGDANDGLGLAAARLCFRGSVFVSVPLVRTK